MPKVMVCVPLESSSAHRCHVQVSDGKRPRSAAVGVLPMTPLADW